MQDCGLTPRIRSHPSVHTDTCPHSQIQDGPLALLHHMCEATGTRSAFILVPGTKRD